MALSFVRFWKRIGKKAEAVHAQQMGTLRMWRISLVVLLSVFALTDGKTIYVDDDANGLNNGSSWVNAYKFLQDALADANSAQKPVEIRIGTGIYKPDRSSAEPNGTGDRQATFRLVNGVSVKGGYAGFGQPDPNARDIDSYETNFSGDLEGNDDKERVYFWEPTRGENSYHVVTGSGTDVTAVLDGCTITGGNANEPISYGGGMYNISGGPNLIECRFVGNSAAQGAGVYNWKSSPTFTRCYFAGNTAMGGAGVTNASSNPVFVECEFNLNGGNGMSNHRGSKVIVKACIFRDNIAYSGGGMYNEESNLTLIDCTFDNNQAMYGGGFSYNTSSPEVIRCWFTRNYANVAGGGIANFHGDGTFSNCIIAFNEAPTGGGMSDDNNSNPSITNTTIYGNLAQEGGGIYNVNSSPVITNCILWANVGMARFGESNQIYGGTPRVTYCCIFDWRGLGGPSNIGSDPLLSNPNNGDYHLKSQAGRWDANEGRWTKDDVTSSCIDAGNPASPIGLEPFPNGGIINMGAYGGTVEASKSYFGEPVCEMIIAGDINGDCKVNFFDFALMAHHWLDDHNP